MNNDQKINAIRQKLKRFNAYGVKLSLISAAIDKLKAEDRPDDRMIALYQETIDKAFIDRAEIFGLVETIRDVDIHCVIFSRYILGKPWKIIESDMHISHPTAMRLHKRGLFILTQSDTFGVLEQKPKGK